MILKPARLALTSAILGIGLSLAPTPAFAVSKEMIQLQTQIQQLQDAVARLQQSNDERMGVLKDLVQQSSDSVNRMSLNMDALQKQMHAQQEAQGTKLDQVSTQVQALNDSLDEMKARIANLEKTLQTIQNQVQSINSNQPAASPNTASPLSQPSTPLPSDNSQSRRGKPLAGTPLDAAPAPVASGAPPAADLYKLALGDYMSAKYSLASAEFDDVVHAYPDNSLAGNSWYYLGEIDYRNGKFADAAKSYDHVLEQYPGNPKIPAAQLHKAQSLISQKQTEAGIRELRSLIGRYPNSPEATQARSKLSAMGVPVRQRNEAR